MRAKNITQQSSIKNIYNNDRDNYDIIINNNNNNDDEINNKPINYKNKNNTNNDKINNKNKKHKLIKNKINIQQ